MPYWISEFQVARDQSNLKGQIANLRYQGSLFPKVTGADHNTAQPRGRRSSEIARYGLLRLGSWTSRRHPYTRPSCPRGLSIATLTRHLGGTSTASDRPVLWS
jgi:hypothetical protein